MFSGIAVQSKYTICSVMLVTQAYYSCVSWYISPSPLCQRLEYCCFSRYYHASEAISPRFTVIRHLLRDRGLHNACTVYRP